MHSEHTHSEHHTHSSPTSSNGKLIAIIIFMVFSLILIGGLSFIAFRHSKCVKNCVGGKCSFFGSCSLTPKATVNKCEFPAGTYRPFTPTNCTPKDDDDGSCNKQCTPNPKFQSGDQTSAFYIKSLGGCVNVTGAKAYCNCSSSNPNKTFCDALNAAYSN